MCRRADKQQESETHQEAAGEKQINPMLQPKAGLQEQQDSSRLLMDETMQSNQQPSGTETEQSAETKKPPEKEQSAAGKMVLPTGGGREKLCRLQEKLKRAPKGGWSSKNSDRFNAVDRTLTNLDNTMRSNQLGHELGRDREILSEVQKQYGAVLEACNAYLNRSACTREGQERAEIVKAIRKLCIKDIGGFRLAYDEMRGISQQDRSLMSWERLLKRIRTTTLNMDHNRIKRPGSGQASDVYILDEENTTKEENGEQKALEGTLFFKPSEIIDPKMSAGKLAILKYQREFPQERLSKKTIAAWENATMGGGSKPIDKKRKPLTIGHQERMERIFVEYWTFSHALSHHGGFDQLSQVNMAERNVASSRMAELLGVEHLVAKSSLVKLGGGTGDPVAGIAMEGAKGKNINEWRKDQIVRSRDRAFYDTSKGITNAVVRDMTSLQIYDIICGQMDRHGGNIIYDVDEKTGQVKGFKGIDNDSSFTMRDNATSYQDLGRNDIPIYNQEGELTLAYVDDAMAERVIALPESAVKAALRDLIGEQEIEMTLVRLRKTKKALSEARKKQPNRFLKKEADWESQNVRKQLMKDDKYWWAISGNYVGNNSGGPLGKYLKSTEYTSLSADEKKKAYQAKVLELTGQAVEKREKQSYMSYFSTFGQSGFA